MSKKGSWRGMKKWGVVLPILLASILMALPSVSFAKSSTNYQIPTDVLDSLGQEKTSVTYRLYDAGGQSVIGESQSTSYRLSAGYIYTLNTSPTAPTFVSHGGKTGQNDWITTLTPDLVFTYNDPDTGDICTKYDIEVYDDSDDSLTYSAYNQSTTTPEGSNITHQISGLASGKTYYWKARCHDGDEWSPWGGGKDTWYFRVDATTPDIGALSCYTDNTKATQITSGSWTNDGTVYFEWLDPNSPSDDTFYYEENTISTNDQIDGSESTTTDNYLDLYPLTEGTRYLHVKPKNNAETWGIERVFTIKYDATTPDIGALSCYTDNTKATQITSGSWTNDGTVYFEWLDPNSPSDDTFYYEENTISTNDQIDGSESTTTDNYLDLYSLTEGTRYLHVKPKNNAETWGIERVFTIKYDATPPTVAITVTPDPAPALPAGGLEFKLIFSESMDTSIVPIVSYDPEGATGPQPCSGGVWSTTNNPDDTYTVYNDNEIDKTTGDGIATISVSGAQDLAENVMVPDTDDTFVINAKPITIQNEGALPLSFNPRQDELTTISYVLSESAVDVDITIIDQDTNLVVRNLVTDKPKDGGLNTVDWDGKNNEGDFVINPGEVKKYSAIISAQSSVSGDQDEVTILNIEADSTLPVIRIISDDDPILRYLGENIATISYETKAPGDNVTLNRNIKIWDSIGNVVYQIGFENEVEGSHTWTWDASDATTFPEGMYQYEILAKTLPPKPKSANSKKGIIVILDENNIEPSWTSEDKNVKVNSSATGPTITITRLTPEEEPTDATKAILTADPSLYLQSSMYDIIADPSTDFVPPAILTFSYDPTLVGEIKDKLQIRYFDTATNSWVPVERQYIDIVNHQIIAEIDKLSLFTLFTCDDTTPPVVTITSPEAKEYYHTTDGEPTIIDIIYTAQDPVVSGFSSGVVKEIILLNGEEYEYAEIDLSTLVGENTLTVKAIDKAGNMGWSKVKFTVVLVAQVTIKPETLKVTPGVLTAYVEFPEGYNVAGIVDATCDGAAYERMMLNDDGTKMIIKFRRDDIEKALAELDPPQSIDTTFKVRGTVQDAYGTYIFEGTDTIMKVLGGGAPPEKGKGKPH